MPAIAFDRFHRYAELTELLHAFVREYPQPGVDRIDRQEPRGPRHLRADRHQHRDRPRVRQAGDVGRRQHPRHRGRGLGREPVLPRHAGARPRHRSGNHPRARHAGVLRLPADESRRRRMGAGRPAEVGPLEHAAVPVRRGRDRGPDRRGHRRRRPDPADAPAGRERPVEGAPGRAGADDPARAHRDRRQLLPDPARGHARRLRRLHAEAEAAEAGPRPQPQLPGELAAGVRAARRGARIRRRSRRCAPSSTSSRVTPTSPAARRSTPGAACCCGRSSTCPTTRCTPRTCGSTAAPATRARSSPAIRRSRSTTSSATTRSR